MFYIIWLLAQLKKLKDSLTPTKKKNQCIRDESNDQTLEKATFFLGSLRNPLSVIFSRVLTKSKITHVRKKKSLRNKIELTTWFSNYFSLNLVQSSLFANYLKPGEIPSEEIIIDGYIGLKTEDEDSGVSSQRSWHFPVWHGLGKHDHVYLCNDGAGSEPRPNKCLEIWVKELKVLNG